MSAPIQPSCKAAVFGAVLLLTLGRPATARAEELELPPPGQPRMQRHWAQYGAAFTSEGRAKAGDVCPDDATAPCILGSGGGLALRAGQRSESGWYWGIAYEFSRQDASNLLRLPILQQLRGETRAYLFPGQRLVPYLTGAVGFALYGSEWGAETYGPMVSVGAGVEFETTRGVFLGVAPIYRVIRLEGWRDKAGQDRPDAFAHFIALEFTLEVRILSSRWGDDK